MVDAILKELILRKNYLNTPVTSIYFGGGTPSQLSLNEIESIFKTIYKNYNINEEIEITLEANPDDLNLEYLSGLKEIGVNRLSIGVQSFREKDLKFMNRAHSTKQSIDSINLASIVGFSHVSIDLIYGIQGLGNEEWLMQLNAAQKLPIDHLSCYSLTVEPQTPLAKAIRLGKTQDISDDQSADQFEILQSWALENGFEHYEISNLAKEGGIAQHNSSYWKGAHYLGIGPSAHSFNGISRSINVPNNSKYIKSVNTGFPQIEMEEIDDNVRFNEIVLTGLRTKWGIQKEELIRLGKKYVKHFQIQSLLFKNKGMIVESNNSFTLSPNFWLNADGIARDLFI